MYLECLFLSRGEAAADEQASKLKGQIGAKQMSEVYKSKEYRSSIRINHKFIDSALTTNSKTANQRLKDTVEKSAVAFVLVSPLKADLETCHNIFGDNSNVSIIVDPLLVPRINSLASISEGNPEILSKFNSKPNLVKLEANPKWYLTFGKGGSATSTFKDAVAEIEKDENYESLEHYHERLREFRNGLINYDGLQKSKPAVIAHPSVLEALTATGHHEDYTLINSVSFGFGEVKSQFVQIEGVEGESQNSGIPFCS